jgi:hypothetical protein
MFSDIRKFVNLYDCSILTSPRLDEKPMDLTFKSDKSKEIPNYFKEPNICIAYS